MSYKVGTRCQNLSFKPIYEAKIQLFDKHNKYSSELLNPIND